MAQRPSALKHLASITSPEKLFRVLQKSKCLTEEGLHNRETIINTVRRITDEKKQKIRERESYRRSHMSEHEQPLPGESTLGDLIGNYLQQYLNERGIDVFDKKSRLSRWQIFRFKFY